MHPHPRFQQGYQFGLHEGVVVGDVEADDAGGLQVAAKAGLEAAAVDRLHDEDQVGPVQMLGRQGLVRIGGQAGGGGLDARPVGKHPLRRGGAQAIAGTEEEEVGRPSTLFLSAWRKISQGLRWEIGL